MVLLPNLVNSKATLRVQALRTIQMSWIIVDMNGKTVHSFERQLTSGVNDIELILSALPSGYYHLQGQTKKGNTGSLGFLKL